MFVFFFRVNILEAELFSKNVKRKENTGNLVFICYSHVIIIFHIRLKITSSNRIECLNYHSSNFGFVDFCEFSFLIVCMKCPTFHFETFTILIGFFLQVFFSKYNFFELPNMAIFRNSKASRGFFNSTKVDSHILFSY